MFIVGRGLALRQLALRSPRPLSLRNLTNSACRPKKHDVAIKYPNRKPTVQDRPTEKLVKGAKGPKEEPKVAKLSYQSYAETLAAKPGPTLLYAAPSHRVFMISSYTGAIFCFSYAAISLQTNTLYPPEGLSTWVPYAFSVICLMMAGMGGWLALGPARIIRQIAAVPNKQFAGGLEMRITLRKMFPLPFMPPRILSVAPEEVVLNSRLFEHPFHDRQLSNVEKINLKRAQEEIEKAAREIEESKVLSRPFRHASQAFHSLFRNVARTWSREGFKKLDVKGQLYKLDVTGGWTLDDGRAIERLVRVKPGR